MSVNGIGTGNITEYNNTYKTAKSGTPKAFEVSGSQNSDKETDVLGIGFLDVPGTNMKYGMKAEYAEDYSQTIRSLRLRYKPCRGLKNI